MDNSRIKRSRTNNSTDPITLSKPQQPPLAVPTGHVSFRLLCNASRIGGVIGKSGHVIKQLQQATSAKIRIEDAPPSSSDRIITVIASNAVKSVRFPLTGNGGGVINGVEVSIAQEALIRVFERILDVAAEEDKSSLQPESTVIVRMLVEGSQVGSIIGKAGKVVEKMREETGCKIRVVSVENLECVAGPNDKIVEIEGDVLAVKKAIVAVSARLQGYAPVENTNTIRTRPHEAVHHETWPDIRVDNLSVEKTNMIRSRPHEAVHHETWPDIRVDHLSIEKKNMIRSRPHEAVYHETWPDIRIDFPQKTVLPPLSNCSMSNVTGRYPSSIAVERAPAPSFGMKKPQEEVKFRILCSTDRVGGVIGNKGTIIKALQNETGASISISAFVPECDERLISITALENMESRYSPAQNALIQVFKRSVETGLEKGLDSEGSPIITRLVVPSNQIGCLLGKGGTIVTEMRIVTGAGIKVIGPDQIPKCTSENDKIVQISGEFSNVQDALYHVTGRLRENIIPNKTNSDAETRSGSSVVTEVSPYRRVRDPTSYDHHPSFGISHNLNRNTRLTQSGDHLGLSHSHNLDNSISPQLWESKTTAGVNPRCVTGVNLDDSMSPKSWQPQTTAGANSRCITDVGRGMSTHRGGLELGSGSRTAMVTNTTVEIVVPDNVVGSVYGENGSNLARLRQISGARVVMHEPQPGSRERIVVISGTPDETQSAQSLLHTFILTGTS